MPQYILSVLHEADQINLDTIEQWNNRTITEQVLSQFLQSDTDLNLLLQRAKKFKTEFPSYEISYPEDLKGEC